MKNTTLPCLLLCALGHAVANGQSVYGELDVNAVRARFYAHGLIGADPGGQPNFEVSDVSGGGSSALYSASLWIAGTSSDNQLHLAAMKYEANGEGDYYTGPLTTDGSAGTNASMMAQYNHVWSVTREQVAEHLAYFNCLADPDNCDIAQEFPDGYVIPPSFFEWPAINTDQAFSTYQAPFYDFNGDGDYDPSVGDAPCMLGDQALYFVFNDKVGPHILTGGQPIGLEVQAMPFAYTSSKNAINQSVFVHYHIINRGTLTLTNTRIGIFNDFDLGCGDDDFVGTDAARNLTYVYNADNIDENCYAEVGYGTNPPAFGMVMLKGPFLDNNAADDALDNTLPSWNGSRFGDGVADNELFGLTKVIHMYREGSSCCDDPSTSLDYRNYLNGYWKDGTPLTYGGNGYATDPGAVECAFSFPGDSDPVGAGTYGVPQVPWSESVLTTLDRRTVSSMGPFTLEPGMHTDLLVAYVYARAADGPAASVAALRTRVDSVRTFAHTLPLWDAFSTSFQGGCEGVTPVGTPELPAIGELRLFPVPASDRVRLEAPRALVGELLVLHDATGRIVATHRLSQGLNEMDITPLAPGMYSCEVRSAKTRYTGKLVKE